MDELKIRIETDEYIYEEWIIEWGENYDRRIIRKNVGRYKTEWWIL